MPLEVQVIQRLEGWDVIGLMETLYGVEDDEAADAVFSIMRVNGTRVWGRAGVRSPTTLGHLRATVRDGDSQGQWDIDALLSDLCARGELAPGDYEILYEE